MYSEDNKSSIIKTILKFVIGIIILVIFILILLKVFPTKDSLNPLYQETFRNNINSMKDAAGTYYTNDRLPVNVGDSVKMTLKEMLDKKLLLPFVDRYNKGCDLENSYVIITKTETEYELKVNLVCSKEEAYIIEHMGCNDKCLLLGCNKGDKTITEYQFVRDVTKKVVDKYSCSSGYTLKGDKCYSTKSVTDTKKATPIYKTSTERINPNKEYIDKLIEIDATKNYTTSEKDPNSKYSEWGNKETHEYLSAEEIDLVNKTSCPSGYTKIGTRTLNNTTVIRCMISKGSMPSSTDTVRVTKATYDNNGKQEDYLVKGPEKVYSKYLFKVGSVTIKTCSKYNYFIDTTTNYVYSYGGSSYGSVDGIDFISCAGTCDLYPIFYTSGSDGKYNSYSAVGTTNSSLRVTCDVKEEKIDKYAEGKRITSYKYNWYKKYTTETRTVNNTCDAGYDYDSSKNKCVKKVLTGYSCPSGYELDGTTCKKYEKVYTNTCPSGYTLKDNYCYKNTKEITGYKCDKGYTLKDKTCTRTYDKSISVKADATYKTSYSKEYKWSTETKISGWERTGKTRTVKVNGNKKSNCVCN